jgi:hypothetical protein
MIANRLTIENCTVISAAALQTAIRKEIRKSHPEATHQEVFDMTGSELVRFSANDQFFTYTQVTNKMGGYRWFFKCPKCGSRVGKLFLPPFNLTHEHVYACKECHKLKNQSALMGQSKIYMKVIRPLKRMQDIENKLQRGYLSSDKIKELLDEYDILDKDVKSCQEYRLYMFRKRHEKPAPQAAAAS